MTAPYFPAHGGAIDEAEARFGPPGPDGWLDLSTGVSPFAYPIEPLPPEAWTRLPTATAVRAFTDTVRRVHGLEATAAVLPTAGEQAALQWLPYCDIPPGPVIVPDMGYRGHETAWSLAGRSVVRDPQPLSRAGDAAVVVVISPNNPTGETVSATEIERAAQKQAAVGGWLIVDEAFLQASSADSALPLAGRPGLIVLRSFGKFFGLPGVRLGWAAGPATVIDRLAARLGSWAVSGPALCLGRRAEADTAWIAAQQQRLRRRARHLKESLAAVGATPVGGTALFQTVRVPDPAHALEWRDSLAEAGILVRIFAERPAWIRFGLCATESDENRLRAALSPLQTPPDR